MYCFSCNALSSLLSPHVLLHGRYGGVVVRDAVRDGADWFVDHFDILSQALKRHQVAFIGSGKQIRYTCLNYSCDVLLYL